MAFTRWGESTWYVYPSDVTLCCHYTVEKGFFFERPVEMGIESMLERVRAGGIPEPDVQELKEILEEYWDEIKEWCG